MRKFTNRSRSHLMIFLFWTVSALVQNTLSFPLSEAPLERRQQQQRRRHFDDDNAERRTKNEQQYTDATRERQYGAKILARDPEGEPDGYTNSHRAQVEELFGTITRQKAEMDRLKDMHTRDLAAKDSEWALAMLKAKSNSSVDEVHEALAKCQTYLGEDQTMRDATGALRKQVRGFRDALVSASNTTEELTRRLRAREDDLEAARASLLLMQQRQQGARYGTIPPSDESPWAEDLAAGFLVVAACALLLAHHFSLICASQLPLPQSPARSIKQRRAPSPPLSSRLGTLLLVLPRLLAALSAVLCLAAFFHGGGGGGGGGGGNDGDGSGEEWRGMLRSLRSMGCLGVEAYLALLLVSFGSAAVCSADRNRLGRATVQVIVMLVLGGCLLEASLLVSENGGSSSGGSSGGSSSHGGEFGGSYHDGGAKEVARASSLPLPMTGGAFWVYLSMAGGFLLTAALEQPAQTSVGGSHARDRTASADHAAKGSFVHSISGSSSSSGSSGGGGADSGGGGSSLSGGGDDIGVGGSLRSGLSSPNMKGGILGRALAHSPLAKRRSRRSMFRKKQHLSDDVESFLYSSYEEDSHGSDSGNELLLGAKTP